MNLFAGKTAGGDVMRKWFISILVLLVAVSGIVWSCIDKDMRRLILNLPTARDVLFWSVPQRDAAFRAMDRLTFLVKSRTIDSGNTIYPLPEGIPLDAGTDIDAYMKDQRTAALVIVHNGKIRLSYLMIPNWWRASVCFHCNADQGHPL